MFNYSDDVNAKLKIEKAYGAYLCWRALVVGQVDPIRFARDDSRIEERLRHSRIRIVASKAL